MLVESHTSARRDDAHVQAAPGRALPQRQGDDVGGRRASLNRWGKVGSRGIVVFNIVEAVTAPDKYTVVMPAEGAVRAAAGLPGPAQSSAAAIMPKEIAEATPAGPGHRVRRHRPVQVRRSGSPTARSSWPAGTSTRRAAKRPAGTPARRDALVDEVIYYPVGNVATRIAGVQSGDYDIADADQHRSLRAAQGDARVVPDVHQPGAWLVFFFNKKAGIMANVKLRQAVMAALSMQPDPAGHRGESRPVPADAQHLS